MGKIPVPLPGAPKLWICDAPSGPLLGQLLLMLCPSNHACHAVTHHASRVVRGDGHAMRATLATSHQRAPVVLCTCDGRCMDLYYVANWVMPMFRIERSGTRHKCRINRSYEPSVDEPQNCPPPVYLDVQRGEMTAKRIRVFRKTFQRVITQQASGGAFRCVGIQTLLIGEKNRWLDRAWYSDSARNKP